MTQYIDFIPSQVQVPTFQVTLDGNIYTVRVTWNLFAQRYYINITSLNGDLVVCEPLVGSPVGLPVETISWLRGVATLRTSAPHFYSVGQTVDLALIGVTPSGYNGLETMFVTGPSSLTFQQPTDPGQVTVPGFLQNNINLVSGLFTNTLVYREPNRQFEVN